MERKRTEKRGLSRVLRPISPSLGRRKAPWGGAIRGAVSHRVTARRVSQTLARIDRLIAEGEQRILRIRRDVAKLDAKGFDTSAGRGMPRR